MYQENGSATATANSTIELLACESTPLATPLFIEPVAFRKVR
jgi:hypothetical protein